MHFMTLIPPKKLPASENNLISAAPNARKYKRGSRKRMGIPIPKKLLNIPFIPGLCKCKRSPADIPVKIR